MLDGVTDGMRAVAPVLINNWVFCQKSLGRRPAEVLADATAASSVSMKRSRASHLSGAAPHLVQVVRVLPDEGSAEGLTVGHADRDHLIGVGRTRAQAVVTLTMDRQRGCGEAEEV